MSISASLISVAHAVAEASATHTLMVTEATTSLYQIGIFKGVNPIIVAVLIAAYFCRRTKGIGCTIQNR